MMEQESALASTERWAQDLYERSTVEGITRAWAHHLIDLAALSDGVRVLDVACGTGIVARLAINKVGRRGRVVGLDINGERLAYARSLEPAVEWREASAMAMPFDDGSFDVVFCLHGLQLMKDRLDILREMRRVLAPGGRLVLAVWRSLEESPLFAALLGAVARRAGTDMPRAKAFMFGNAENLHGLLFLAGFEEIDVKPTTLNSHFPSVENFVRDRVILLSRTRFYPTWQQLGETGQAAVIDEVTDAVRGYVDEQGVSAPMGANVAVAVA